LGAASGSQAFRLTKHRITRWVASGEDAQKANQDQPLNPKVIPSRIIAPIDDF